MGFCEALSITKGFVSCDAADPYQQGIKELKLERGRGFRSVLEQAGCWGAALQGGFVLPPPTSRAPFAPRAGSGSSQIAGKEIKRHPIKKLVAATRKGQWFNANASRFCYDSLSH